MLAVFASGFSSDDPLSVLEVAQRPDPVAADGWTTVQVKAASLNHHDLWSLRGVGLAESALPMILGCDAAGVTAEGQEVIVHSVIGSPQAGGGDETFDPGRSLLSEKHQGTFAQWVSVPTQNLIAKPSALSFAEAACLPTAWLTAYRMLFTRGDLQPGETVLIQGTGGGVASAAIALARHAGARVWATTRDKAALRVWVWSCRNARRLVALLRMGVSSTQPWKDHEPCTSLRVGRAGVPVMLRA